MRYFLFIFLALLGLQFAQNSHAATTANVGVSIATLENYYATPIVAPIGIENLFFEDITEEDNSKARPCEKSNTHYHSSLVQLHSCSKSLTTSVSFYNKLFLFSKCFQLPIFILYRVIIR